VRLAPFNFRVKHTCGADNLVADALSHMYSGEATEDGEALCGALLESLSLVYSSLDEHQKQDEFCKKIQDQIQGKWTGAEGFQVYRGLLCYFPKRAKRRRWIMPPILRNMLLKYYHDAVFSALLGTWKTYHRIAANF